MDDTKQSDNEFPLAGVVVLDVTIAYAGPLASVILSGLGATVIKIERPGIGDLARTNPPYIGVDGISVNAKNADDVALPFINRSRGKLGLTLDLKAERGIEIFNSLAAKADVIVENYSTNALTRLGIGYEAISKINPRLVYCSLSGFGADAAAADLQAFDLMIQALSGVMAVTGEPGAPPVRQGLVVGDIMAPLMCVVGILSALLERQTSGLGQYVDVSMLDSLTSLIAAEHFDALEDCGIPSRSGNSLARMAPFGAFPTLTNHVAVCAPSDKFMENLARAMKQPELMSDPRFGTRASRTAFSADLDSVIEAWTSTMSAEDVIAALTESDVPAAIVRGPRDAIHDARVTARSAVVPLRHPRHGQTADVVGMGIPINFSRSTSGFEGRDAPFLGEHNEYVLGELLGYDADRIAELAKDGII